MNKLKISNKILSVVLLVGIIFTSSLLCLAVEDDVPVPDRFLSASTLTDNSKYKNIHRLLSYLGIVDEELESMNMTKNATRAYSAKLIARAVCQTVSVTAEAPFSDVMPSDDYASEIACAKSLGIIPDATRFYPDKEITYDELATWIVNALNYDKMLGNKTVYLLARQLGIFEGLEYSDKKPVTMEELFIVMENMLNVDLPEISYKDKGNEYYKGEMNTILSERNIGKHVGVVTGYRYLTFDGNSEIAEGKIQINKHEFNTLEEYETGIVGKAVCSYVDYNNGKETVITLWEDSYENNVWSREKNLLKSVNANVIEYTENKNEKKIKVSNDAIVFSNGIYFGNLLTTGIDTVIENATKFDIVDNNGDESADIIYIHKYEDYVIDTVSDFAKTITFMYNKPSVKITDSNIVNIVFDKAPIELKDLKRYNIATVEKGKLKTGTEVINITISKNQIDGAIDETGSDKTGDYYVISGNKYYLSDDYKYYLENNTNEEKPKMGKDAKFYISTRNEIAASSYNSAYEYGYLRGVMYNEFEEQYQIRIFSQSGKFQVLDLEPKVTLYTPESGEYIAGKRVDSVTALEKMKSGINDVVAYIAKNNVISTIALPMDRTMFVPNTIDYPLTKDYTRKSDSGESRVYMGMLASRYYILNANTIRFPEDEAQKDNEKYYKTGQFSSLGYGNDVYIGADNTITLYNVNKFFTPKFVTIEQGSVLTERLDYTYRTYMIESVYTGLDSDENPVKKISYYNNGILESSIIRSDADLLTSLPDKQDWVGTTGYGVNDLVQGDIIQFKKDNAGEIDALTIVMKYNEATKAYGTYRVQTYDGGEISAPVKEAKTENIAMVYGKLLGWEGNLLLINVADDGESTDDPTCISSHYMSNVYGGVTFVLFDTETMKQYSIKKEDLLPGDTVVVKKNWGQANDIYVIR